MTDRPRSDAHALPKHLQSPNNMNDSQFIAHVLIQACKLMLKLLSKRWPELA
jgi:hypothetical protein